MINSAGWSTNAENAPRGLGMLYLGGGSLSSTASTTLVCVVSPALLLVSDMLMYGSGSIAARFCTADDA